MSRDRVCAWNPLGRFATIDVFDYFYYYHFQTSFRRVRWKKNKITRCGGTSSIPSTCEYIGTFYKHATCARSLEAGPLQETSLCISTKIPRRCRQLPPPFSRARTHSRDQWSVIILAKFLLFPCTDIDIFFLNFIHPLHLTPGWACRIAPECHFRVYIVYCGHRVKKKSLGVGIGTLTYVHRNNK